MTHYITPEFEALIGASRFASLNSHPSTVYGLDSEFNISYLNPAWFEFAEKNSNNIFDSNEWLLGRNVFDSIPETLGAFYRNLFESSLKEEISPIISRQSEYECSSPELYRRFSMHLYPINKNGIVVVHSLLIEEPYVSPANEGQLKFDKRNYIDKDGILHQCANCRRIQNLNDLERWDWIPKFIEQPYSNTSHAVCPPCRHHYYLSGE